MPFLQSSDEEPDTDMKDVEAEESSEEESSDEEVKVNHLELFAASACTRLYSVYLLHGNVAKCHLFLRFLPFKPADGMEKGIT